MQTLLLALLLLLPLTVQAEYFGDLSANELNPNSIFNDIGAYGPLSPASPRNSIGINGSPISLYTPTNPFAIDAPRLYDQAGNYRGKLSTIPHGLVDSPRIGRPIWSISWLIGYSTGRGRS